MESSALLNRLECIVEKHIDAYSVWFISLTHFHQCERKETFIQQIQCLDIDTQAEIALCIQEVSEFWT